jgi:superfamily I DNA and/or RNA helicase
LEAEKLRAAWQLFFLVVPVVSTTFASMGRMFGGVGCEAIGWLMVDEAGQSSPQCAAGGILRAQRVIVVGDPQQLVPVVTVPQKAERDIASHYGVSETWVPSRASVQTLADRVARYGATMGQGENEVWVSAPLRVHRRCDEPMFSLCNAIAYDGIMVSGVHRNLSDPASPDRFDSESGRPPIAKSYWADERAVVSVSHLQQSEIERVHKALAYLTQHGIHESEIIVISPFRMVADRLTELMTRYPGLRAGTIHTAQGREAPVVILVLGGDPSRPRAKAWAASTPNLVNVAASRAQRRLYVIGDRVAWEQHNYFRELSAVLK